MSNRLIKLILLTIVLLFGMSCFAFSSQPSAAKTDAAKTDAAKTDAAKTDAAKTDAAKTDAAKDDNKKTDLSGFNFGAALGVVLDQGKEDPIEKATIVNGVIRVDKENETMARFLIESHYFFTTEYSFLWTAGKDTWGHGPFIALQPGSNNSFIDTIGAGWMIGFKRPKSFNSWNFGVGIMVDPDAQVLGDGLKANRPLPEGETEVRYKTCDQWGALFISSCSF